MYTPVASPGASNFTSYDPAFFLSLTSTDTSRLRMSYTLNLTIEDLGSSYLMVVLGLKGLG